MRRTGVLLTIVIALPLSVIAMVALVKELSDQFNPCVRWEPAAFGSYRMGAGERCAQMTVRSETRSQAAIRVLAVPGVIVFGAVIGVLGTARRRPMLVFAAACLMFIEALPLVFSFWPLALVTGAWFLYVANRLRPPHPEPGIP